MYFVRDRIDTLCINRMVLRMFHKILFDISHPNSADTSSLLILPTAITPPVRLCASH